MKKMKLYILYTFIGLAAIFSLSSCNDFEDVPIEEFTKDYVFSTTDSMGTMARAFLLTAYSYMPNGNRIDNEYLDAASDDGVSTELGSSDAYKLQVGRYSANSRVASDMKWKDFYDGIRQCNIFIDNIDVVPLKDTFNGGIRLNRAWKAEAKFLRAFFHFELIKRYGGVTIMKNVYDIDDDLELPRNTFEECVNYIVEELDAIKDSLRTVPIANTANDGHVVTKEAAMALKARVLLYAASPLFNGKTLAQGNPLVGYTDEKESRWNDAAKAAKWFIDSYGPAGENKYFFDPEFRICSPFITYYGEGNNEVIFYRSNSKGNWLEKVNSPVGYTGNTKSEGRNNPTQNLVDAFLMKDGRTIREALNTGDYSDDKMYLNRDPRLDSTVFHNGSLWLTQTVATYENGKNKPNSLAIKTVTSYYVRKFLGKFEEKTQYSDDTHHPWVMFRYAEILLNYAEAQNEVGGPESTAAVTPGTTGQNMTPYDAIKEIRRKSGIEAGADNMYGLRKNLTKDQMREVIQNERRIELAFEEHRYWDIRRWKIAKEIFNRKAPESNDLFEKRPLEGLIIVRTAGVNEMNRVPIYNASTGNPIRKEDINFEDKRYLYPIPYSEVIKNRNMIQNPEW